ncbi:helix-turn-helix transcriptional regulator [Myroides odoratus]|uniref:helix-turn-helix domain-containing protein n=1 Tax=Myroides odoratus TaxID=256 RepID=UPI003341260D
METIGSRLRKYLEFKGVSRKDFASDIEIIYSSLNRILNSDRAMNSDTLSKVLEYFPDLNARWFLTGKGPMEYTAAAYFIDKEKESIVVKETPIVKEEPMYDRDQLLREFIEDEDVLNAVRNLLDKALEKNVKQTENKK